MTAATRMMMPMRGRDCASVWVRARRSDQVAEEDRRPQPGADGPNREQQPGSRRRRMPRAHHVGHIGPQDLFLPELVTFMASTLLLLTAYGAMFGGNG